YDLSRIAQYAADALGRLECFASEHNLAREVLQNDVPTRRRWLQAALHILDFGEAKLRADFLLGNEVDRQRLVRWVIARGGIYETGKSQKVPLWGDLSKG